ncbi:MAG: hypothetical protein WCJ84_01825 [Candidatus Peregrinibacteria bacterium]
MASYIAGCPYENLKQMRRPSGASLCTTLNSSFFMSSFQTSTPTLYSLQTLALHLLDASSLSERLKNTYRAIVWFLPEPRVKSMIEKLEAEKRIREEITRRATVKK